MLGHVAAHQLHHEGVGTSGAGGEDVSFGEDSLSRIGGLMVKHDLFIVTEYRDGAVYRTKLLGQVIYRLGKEPFDPTQVQGAPT